MIPLTPWIDSLNNPVLSFAEPGHVSGPVFLIIVSPVGKNVLQKKF